MLKKILLGLVLAIAGLLAFAATRPDSYRVERTAHIAAPAPVVFAQIEDLRAWSAWSPWDKLDPQMTKTFDGPAKGVGASYAWQGNDEVGKGKMTITESEPPARVRIQLEFVEPFASVADTTFSVAPAGAGEVAVTWAMQGANNFVGKLFGIFMDMDAMIGKDFEKGLAALEDVAEAEATRQAEAAAAAARARAEMEAAARAQADAAGAATPAPAPSAEATRRLPSARPNP